MKLKLLAALAARVTTIDVEGHGPLRLRELTVAENDAIRDLVKAKGENAPASEMGLQLLVRSAIDDEDKPVFTEEDLPVLRASGGQRVEALVMKVLEVQGHRTPERRGDEKNVSAPTAAGASDSGSPSP